MTMIESFNAGLGHASESMWEQEHCKRPAGRQRIIVKLKNPQHPFLVFGKSSCRSWQTPLTLLKHPDQLRWVLVTLERGEYKCYILVLALSLPQHRVAFLSLRYAYWWHKPCAETT